MPLYSKSSQFIKHAFKSLTMYNDNYPLYKKVKTMLVTNNLVKLRKIFIYMFWLFMAMKFPSVEVSESIVSDMRKRLNKHYIEVYMGF
jgi:uncharacterized membrane protein